MNTHVNFEIAKPLKEKGFEGIKSPLWYYKDGTLHETPTEGYKGLKCWNTWEDTQGVRWDAPTIAEVVMWLYEKHGVWIYTYKIKPFIYDDIPYPEYVWVSKCDEKFIDSNNGLAVNHHYSPTEAYKAAILYTLNNLI